MSTMVGITLRVMKCDFKFPEKATNFSRRDVLHHAERDVYYLHGDRISLNLRALRPI